MILTVTLNPALDVTYRVDRLRPHRTHRVSAVESRPGGKGVNVAAVLAQLREPVVATGLCGGPTGDRIRAGLSQLRIPDGFVAIAAESRRTLVVADDDATGFWEPGPPVTRSEWDAFLSRYRGLLKVSRAVVLSGSLPAGLPDTAYAELIDLARELGVTSILDTSGDPLRAGVTAGPDLVKPNAAELAAYHGTPPGRNAPGADGADTADAPATTGDTGGPGRSDGAGGTDESSAAGGPGGADEARGSTAAGALVGARRMCADGARAVVVSRASEGLLAVTPDGDFRVVPPGPVAGNPTGAGDAAVAALARALAYRTDWPEALADAVAVSAAAVAEPVAGRFDEAAYDRARRAVSAEPLEA